MSTNTERTRLVVEQPQKLGSLLETINLIDTISERMTEDASSNWDDSGGMTTQTGAQGTQQDGTSARDKVLANLPKPVQMQKALEREIMKEIHHLKKEMRAVSRVGKPGAAHKLNDLYAKIRRLQGLLSEILEASYDVLKRLFVRIIIDKQPVNQN